MVFFLQGSFVLKRGWALTPQASSESFQDWARVSCYPFRMIGRARMAAAVFAALLSASGCASTPTKPWTTLTAPDGTRIRVYLASPDRVTALYWARARHQPVPVPQTMGTRAPVAQDDLGGPIASGRSIRSFYDRGAKEIWSTDDTEVLLHETQHMLDDVCR